MTLYPAGSQNASGTRAASREEWIGIPVDLTGSGLERSVVDRARATIEGKRRPSKVNGRFYPLSGGILRCGGCGRAMQSYRRKTAAGRHNHYYRCRPSIGPDAGPNRKSHGADALEYDVVFMFERYASRGTLLDLFDRALAEQEKRTGLHDALERRAALSERLGALAKLRRGFQDQHAEGLMTLAELRERLMELDEEKGQIAAELRAAEDATSATRRTQAMREYLEMATWFENPDAVHPSEWLGLSATPEEVRRAYTKYGARFEVDAQGALSLRLSLTWRRWNIVAGRTHLLTCGDPVIAGLVRRVGPLSLGQRRRGRPVDAYGALVRTIVGQQLSTKAARTIYNRVAALFGDRPPTPEEILAADEEALRATGLSRPKISYLRNLARRVIGGELDLGALHDLPDEEVIRQITGVKGLGRWSADMFLMFHLARPDVLPVGDLGIRRAVELAYGLPGLPDADALHDIASPWRPERTLACLYLWESLDMDNAGPV